MGKSKTAKEKKFDRNVEISAPILDPEIIKAIHSPPKGQRSDIKHGGFKALLSDLNSQDSIDELMPLNDNYVPSYIGISCAVSGYSNYSSYSKKAAPIAAAQTTPKTETINSGSKPNRSRATSPVLNAAGPEVNHITIDKNTIHSADEERKELTEKLTASATNRKRSPSPCIPPTEDDRHHGTYVGARYCPLPAPSKTVNKHIPLLGIDDEENPDEKPEEENKVEQRIASLYGGDFVEDWRESMMHKVKKELSDQVQTQSKNSMNPKDLVTLKPTLPQPNDEMSSSKATCLIEEQKLEQDVPTGETGQSSRGHELEQGTHNEEPKQFTLDNKLDQVEQNEKPEQIIENEEPECVQNDEPEQRATNHGPKLIVKNEESEQCTSDQESEQCTPTQQKQFIQKRQQEQDEEPVQSTQNDESEQNAQNDEPDPVLESENLDHGVQKEELVNDLHNEEPDHALQNEGPDHVVQNEAPDHGVHNEGSKQVSQNDEPEPCIRNEESEHCIQNEEPLTTGDSKDGRFYLDLLDKEKSFITEQIAEAEAMLADENASIMNEDKIGKLRSAIGMANLLLNKKFSQFRELCETNINKKADEEFETLNDDLAGYWDMLVIQVNDVKKSFLCDEQIGECDDSLIEDQHQTDSERGATQTATLDSQEQVSVGKLKLSAQKDQARRERLQKHISQMKKDKAASSSNDDLLED